MLVVAKDVLELIIGASDRRALCGAEQHERWPNTQSVSV